MYDNIKEILDKGVDYFFLLTARPGTKKKKIYKDIQRRKQNNNNKVSKMLEEIRDVFSAASEVIKNLQKKNKWTEYTTIIKINEIIMRLNALGTMAQTRQATNDENGAYENLKNQIANMERIFAMVFNKKIELNLPDNLAELLEINELTYIY